MCVLYFYFWSTPVCPRVAPYFHIAIWSYTGTTWKEIKGHIASYEFVKHAAIYVRGRCLRFAANIHWAEISSGSAQCRFVFVCICAFEYSFHLFNISSLNVSPTTDVNSLAWWLCELQSHIAESVCSCHMNSNGMFLMESPSVSYSKEELGHCKSTFLPDAQAREVVLISR